MSGGQRVFLVCTLSVFLFGVVGCRQTVRFAGAAVRQNPLRSIGPSADWTFNGLDARVLPRLRPGSYASATRGVQFLGAADLGPHGYRFTASEQSGIVYTCRAGHVDVSHVRKAADWTGYLAAVVLEHIEKGRTSFQVKQVEPSLYYIELTYPENWTDLDGEERERIAREVSRDLGQYLAWTGLTWHEILTWFGYRFKVWQSEFPSAFSWEDSYSNLLGTHIAVAALQDQTRPFSETVTQLLQTWLAELGIQPAQTASETTEALRGRWFSAQWHYTWIYERNFDVGIDDGYVTPRLAPSVAFCKEPEPWPLAVPTVDRLARYGFSMRLQIEPRVWEERRIMMIVFPEYNGRTRRLEPAVHFPLLIGHIEQDAIARGMSCAGGGAFGG